ncbi:3-hydroxyacyl-CoA dehydrogenase/enoyl-CoA hydratase family protein [Legionella israelensis]|uniref:3-hydroxyacyl CoA dehydrogenase oxidoreductase protein n=1 Tax=Legionella israelensis TaxID=454 RepID=A0A0W0VKW7_9GAMM|nr:3-hydroxyacyl-CoA dehydrogenase/enoyl-CoA hydratase family protein [Legionella israelensis]KTD20757.1 3-hydroxyacyl CoA dehydrogenase oxidoreductase protein [Legionella israelensis]QBS08374.1 3-hydroxyacyl-CoA dehydrogenase/enoyl-CoA hydratase family protein [Legionella israelensis]SCY06796.1 3-hydroxyacyl-CoA dehydrogenase [Legionella israelensis DSM 19235]STX58005.1 3-hydroxyacyl-CoA dehydrogenase [Legionella israelensis]
MTKEAFFIRKVAILGAGVMGAQIAAHCVNAGFETLLFDLAAKEKEKNQLVHQAIAHLNKLKPVPLATAFTGDLLQARNYDEHLDDLGECDLIIEAIAERMDWKEDLYRRIYPTLNKNSILVSNTSGLSINALNDVLPEELKQRFCGVHFFNPPRYMHLAELIPSRETSSELLDQLESWLTSYLGKGVVRAKDTPNFIANRIGVFSLLATLYHAEEMGLGLDEVDALTGQLLGRPKSATLRTMDVVGLDTMQHVVHTMREQLSDDPWHKIFKLPDWLDGLIEKGHLGQKSGQGIYRKKGKAIEVYDIKLDDYRASQPSVHDEIKSIMQNKDAKERLQKLMKSDNPQARFLAACFRDLFHYCAFHLKDIADTVRDVDLAMRWGFGWQKGPFESWQLSGIDWIVEDIRHAINEDKTFSQAKLPEWLEDIKEFYSDKGAFSPESGMYKSRHELPVYKKQIFPDKVLGEKTPQYKTLYENDGVCMWHLQDNVAVVHFKSKANTIGQDVLDGMMKSIEVAEKECKGLILYQHDTSNFSSGANLKEVASLIQAGKMNALENMIQSFQRLAMRLRYSPVPVVAALRGRALGGGCELILHCDSVVAAFESYPGLVEAGVGLIPAGGGCKEMARRAASKAKYSDLMDWLEPYFKQIATAAVAGSAAEAKLSDYFQDGDQYVMHANEVLFTALAKINYLSKANYLPPIPSRFKVAGIEGMARIQTGLVNWLEGGFISEHDYYLATQLAGVLCGGDVNRGQLVDEEWMLKLEREAFIRLCSTQKTQERITHLLETGKPLRN